MGEIKSRDVNGLIVPLISRRGGEVAGVRAMSVLGGVVRLFACQGVWFVMMAVGEES